MPVFPHYSQLDAMDCGPTCLRMIAKYYGRSFTLQSLRERSFISREGVSMLGISDAAESIGLRSMGVRITLKQLQTDAKLPCILHWNQNHFVVLYGISRNRYMIADPASTLVAFTEKEFCRCWYSKQVEGMNTGTALLIEPTPAFYDMENETGMRKRGLSFFLLYLKPFKRQFIQLIIGMLTVSMLQMLLPFLTQSMVDIGVGQSDVPFITLVLIAQLMVFVAQLSVEFIRSWIVLHVNTRINISLISDYLAKLMRLPLRFFDTKMTGDILQRIGDHRRIEQFMTGQSISTLFSFVNFIVFGLILAYYNLTILLVFLIGNFLYVGWVLAFMHYRRELDIRRFAQSATEQSNLIQLVTGMQEIKLNNCEKEERWGWERIQARLFRISVKGLSLGQYQRLGTVFFSQTTNIVISFLAAKAVVNGDITLGMMTSLSYIVGQLSAPVSQIINFSQAFQDAKISLERLNEIHMQDDEEKGCQSQTSVLPEKHDIHISDVFFSYDGADRNYVLDGISLDIPDRKVTAIVGASGSGKTTLIKLLLGFYLPNKGSICIDGQPLQNINPHVWRSAVGAVMQDGFLFSDTIAANIAVGVESIDKERLGYASEVANLREFVNQLPLGFNTRIGMDGNGVSQGQRQRILIARAVYKNPDFLFFDEATNALDANNEQEIMDHLKAFCNGRTVVVVAHRLSTMKDADHIVVLDKGHIVEEGTHQTLTEQRGAYYTLVKNQLELGT